MSLALTPNQNTHGKANKGVQIAKYKQVVLVTLVCRTLELKSPDVDDVG